MDLTIADLKVGAKLVFGNYGVGSAVYPITWLKADRECDFLSEFVLDMLKFDAVERRNPIRNPYYYGNNDYETSNIIQFINSCEEDWYAPMHNYDAPPGVEGRPYAAYGDYLNHAGFLSDFEDYELECLVGRIDLPTFANILGTGSEARFPLFNRKGYRGRPTSDLVCNKGCHTSEISESSFCEFWVSDVDNNGRVGHIDRAGYRGYTSPASNKGLRPKCKLSPDTRVELMADGSYRIVPFAVTRPRGPKVCTDEEFMELMGML